MKTRINADQYSCDGCGKTVMVGVEWDDTDDSGRGKTPETDPPEGWIVGTAEIEQLSFTFHVHAPSCLSKGLQSAHEKTREYER